MNVHDWTRVGAGDWHDFHFSWIADLKGALNRGLLPKGYYAQAEQHSAGRIADVLALHTSPASDVVAPLGGGGLALTAVAPAVTRRMTADRPSKPRGRRTLVVRHSSGFRVVALIEVVSPSNKDRRASVREFVGKVQTALAAGVHVVVVDLFPPGRSDPRSLHGAIWAGYARKRFSVPTDKPLTSVSYAASSPVEAYVDSLAAGDPVPALPLFLTADRYVSLPLGPTYETAFADVPEIWQDVLEGRTAPPPA